MFYWIQFVLRIFYSLLKLLNYLGFLSFNLLLNDTLYVLNNREIWRLWWICVLPKLLALILKIPLKVSYYIVL